MGFFLRHHNLTAFALFTVQCLFLASCASPAVNLHLSKGAKSSSPQAQLTLQVSSAGFQTSPGDFLEMLLFHDDTQSQITVGRLPLVAGQKNLTNLAPGSYRLIATHVLLHGELYDLGMTRFMELEKGDVATLGIGVALRETTVGDVFLGIGLFFLYTILVASIFGIILFLVYASDDGYIYVETY